MLNNITVGYMRMRGIPIQALPVSGPTSAPLQDITNTDNTGASGAVADADASVGADAAPITDAEVGTLSATAAFAFIGRLQENDAIIKLQPRWRRSNERCLTAFAAEPAGTVSTQQAMSIIVREVSREVLPEWVNEIRNRPDSGHFFDDSMKAMNFLHTRYTYITTLFEQFCCGPARVTCGTDGALESKLLMGSAEKVDLLQVSDASQESAEDSSQRISKF